VNSWPKRSSIGCNGECMKWNAWDGGEESSLKTLSRVLCICIYFYIIYYHIIFIPGYSVTFTKVLSIYIRFIIFIFLLCPSFPLS
jgi:hypothetical protein